MALFADVVEHRSQPDKSTCNQAAGNPIMPIHGELIGAIEGAQGKQEGHPLADMLETHSGPNCPHLNLTRVLALLLCHANDSLSAARDDMVKLGKRVG